VGLGLLPSLNQVVHDLREAAFEHFFVMESACLHQSLFFDSYLGLILEGLVKLSEPLP